MIKASWGMAGRSAWRNQAHSRRRKASRSLFWQVRKALSLSRSCSFAELFFKPRAAQSARRWIRHSWARPWAWAASRRDRTPSSVPAEGDGVSQALVSAGGQRQERGAAALPAAGPRWRLRVLKIPAVLPAASAGLAGSGEAASAIGEGRGDGLGISGGRCCRLRTSATSARLNWEVLRRPD